MIEIIFANENFVVCEKPAHVLAVPSRDREDVRSCLGLDLQKQLGFAVFPVHRLDFEVGGVMLFAINAKAHRVAQAWFSEKSIRKQYLAKTSLQDFSHWPENIPTDKLPIAIFAAQQFFWNCKIHRGKKRSFVSEYGDWAQTEAIVESISDNSIEWKLFPLTGKPHQLRLELSRHGFPIDGDTLYGSKVKLAQGAGIALKAVTLDLSQITSRLGLPEMLHSIYKNKHF